MAEVNAVEKQPVTQEYLKKMDAYWRAANYLGAAQLYLLDNPLLREPLTMDHIKKKIVGHWGTVPGQNFVYVHLNRVIKKYDQDMILISGPGHGGNFFVANTYLEGTYSEVYPNIGEDMDGLKNCVNSFLFRAVSQAMLHRKLLVPSTRAVSLDIHWHTLLVRYLTTRIWLQHVSSETVSPRQDRLQLPGSATNF